MSKIKRTYGKVLVSIARAGLVFGHFRSIFQDWIIGILDERMSLKEVKKRAELEFRSEPGIIWFEADSETLRVYFDVREDIEVSSVPEYYLGYRVVKLVNGAK